MSGDRRHTGPGKSLLRSLGLASTGALVVSSLALLPALSSSGHPDSDQAPPVVTFDDIARAENSLDLRVEQIRRVLEPGAGGTAPGWVSIREQLLTSPDPRGSRGAPRSSATSHRFQLEFLGIDGEAVDSVELSRRRQLYRRYAGYLHLYGSLRIDDPTLASRNYAILHLDDRIRLGRPTHRIALLPRRIGRSAWVLEIDVETSYPLFRAEFDASGILSSTLEVTSFEEIGLSELTDVDWWQPSRIVEEHDDVASATASMPDTRFTIPLQREIPAGYELFDVRVVREDLRPEASLVLAYTDGIDDIFVIETVNAPAPSLPAPAGSGDVYAIYVYQDQNVAQFMFHSGSITTLVVGRSGQFALGPLAHDLLSRSISGR